MFTIENRLKLIREGAGADDKAIVYDGMADDVTLDFLDDNFTTESALLGAMYGLYMFETSIIGSNELITEAVYNESTLIELMIEAAESGDAAKQKEALDHIKMQIKDMVTNKSFTPKKGLQNLKMINLLKKRLKLQWAMGLFLNLLIGIPLILLSMYSKYRSIDAETAKQYVSESEEIVSYFMEMKNKTDDPKVKAKLDKAITKLTKGIDKFKERMSTFGNKS
jgi:hypothetical protein